MRKPPPSPSANFDFIAGSFVAPRTTDGTISHCSPADRSLLLATIPWASAQVDRAVEAARHALPKWRATPLDQRVEALRRYQEALRTNAEQIAETIAWEVGKPLWEAKTEVAAMIGKVDLAVGPGAAFTRDTAIDTLPGEIRYRPLGIVAVVGPFNFPGHLPNGHVVPALLSGNAVIMKPSDKAPLTAQWMAQCFSEAGLPQGVFNVVQGTAQVGAQLTCHPDVDGVLFTGSARAGKAVVQQSIDRLDRLIALELGGKNAAVALADCNVERTARHIAFSAFVTAGQRCTATSRLIVCKQVAPALTARIVELAKNLVVGHPCLDQPFMGPMIDEASAARLAQATSDAVAAGYKALLPHKRLSPSPAQGAYIEPSVHLLEGAGLGGTPSYSDEELFAPDLAIYEVDSEEEAFDLVNRSRYGLSASVFCDTKPQFERAASELHVGVLHWNRAGAGASGRLPFSGVKGSGNHRPAGILTALTCTYAQAVLLEQQPPVAANWPGFPTALES